MILNTLVMELRERASEEAEAARAVKEEWVHVSS